MEIHEKEDISLYLSNVVLLDDIETDVQSVQVYQHPKLGKILVIDNEIHNVEKWAPLYHESIVHIPMMFLEKPQSVLILGGGDLYAAEIVLQYPTVKKVILCDYDSEVIRLTKKYYSHAAAVLSNSKLSIVCQDARRYIKECTEKYDLIVDDCFNLVEDFPVEEHIFTQLSNMLTPNVGVCSSLIYRHIFDQFVMSKTKETLLTQHKTVFSLVTVPEYPGILHLLTIWGQSPYLDQNLPASRNRYHIKVMENTKYMRSQLFDPKFCKYYLYLPNYIKNILR